MVENEQSSEVKDDSLAQEALDATASAEETSPAEESGPTEELKVPLHEHTKLRTRAQQAEIAQARLEGELSAIKQQQATDAPPTKSPVDLEMERQAADGIAEEDMAVSPSIIKQQEVFNRQVANQTAQAATKQALLVKQQSSANRAKAAHDDFETVVLAADALMTPGELVDLAAEGDNFGEMVYAKAKLALERNKSEPKTESKTPTAPEKEKSKSEAVPSQQEILKNVEGDATAIAAAQL